MSRIIHKVSAFVQGWKMTGYSPQLVALLKSPLENNWTEDVKIMGQIRNVIQSTLNMNVLFINMICPTTYFFNFFTFFGFKTIAFSREG